jgi:glycogen synthase
VYRIKTRSGEISGSMTLKQLIAILDSNEDVEIVIPQYDRVICKHCQHLKSGNRCVNFRFTKVHDDDYCDAWKDRDLHFYYNMVEKKGIKICL